MDAVFSGLNLDPTSEVSYVGQIRVQVTLLIVDGKLPSGSRLPPVRVLAGAYAAQALAMGATGVVILAGGPAPLAYACAAVAATLVTCTRPTQAALTPALARSPEELTATNVVSGWVENTSILAATAATGVLLDLTGPGVVFAVSAGIGAAAALLVAPVRGPAGAPRGDDGTTPLDEALAGFNGTTATDGANTALGS